MFENLQLAESLDLQEDGSLEVIKVFKTLQSEGPFAGTPAIFIRLSGCNLACTFCDTDYTSTHKRYSPEELFYEALTTRGNSNLDLIVITGGEPFRQNLKEFVFFACRRGARVQIETNGTLFQELNYEYNDTCLTIVCSPKTPKVHPQLEAHISAWKYILDADHVDPKDGLPSSSMGDDLKIARPNYINSELEIFVQPLDEQDPEKNKRNRQAAVESCLKYGYRLSLQLHKELGLE